MPTITFQVNLSNLNTMGHKPPYNQTEADNFPSTRVAYFPNVLRDNRELKHGVQFTVSGVDAVYLKNTYTSGDYKFLDIVSEVP